MSQENTTPDISEKQWGGVFTPEPTPAALNLHLCEAAVILTPDEQLSAARDSKAMQDRRTDAAAEASRIILD